MNLEKAARTLDSELRPQLAELWDRVGLLVGNPERRVRKVAVALDPDPKTVEKAAQARVDMLVTHHPPYLQPPSALLASQPAGKVIHQLIRANMALYCAHTNLDALSWGTGPQLAKALGIQYNRPLVMSGRASLRKVITFVPPTHAPTVRKALAESGAGGIGQYSHCSFSTPGQGSFLPLKGARPAIGQIGTLELCHEERLEMIVPTDRVSPVVRALKRTHPYEMPAYDVVPLENTDPSLGYGCMGILPKPLRADKWAESLKLKLGTGRIVTYNWNPRKTIRNVAAMPGSGGSFLANLPSGVDAFVSGDIKYHDAQNAPANTIIVDAGHDATERPVLRVLRDHVSECLGIRANLITRPRNLRNCT